MIKSPAICDADVWIKLVQVDSYKLIFQTFNEINMVGIVIKEIRCFGGYTDPGRFLDFKLSKGKIFKRRLRDFPPDKIKAFQYTISQYRLKCQTYETDFNKGSTHSGKNSNLGEIVSAVIAQELKIPILKQRQTVFFEKLKNSVSHANQVDPYCKNLKINRNPTSGLQEVGFLMPNLTLL